MTGELKSKIDRIWDAFWSGGISNPLEVIEQITYLLFIRRLDDIHTGKENRAHRFKEPIEDPIDHIRVGHILFACMSESPNDGYQRRCNRWS